MKLQLVEKPNREIAKWLRENASVVHAISSDYAERHPDFKHYSVARYVSDKSLTRKGVTTDYDHAQGKTDGRLYAKRASLQNLPKLIRELLTHGECIDADFENAAPSLLHQHCVQLGLGMNSFKRFCAYVENRQGCFDLMHEKYSMPPSKVKKQFLRLMFGGQLSSDMLHDYWWTGLAHEFRTLLRLICDQYPDEYAATVTRLKKNGEKHKSAEGSVASSVVFNIENSCLLAFKQYLQDTGFEVQALCFDGLLWTVNGDRHPDYAAASDSIFATTGYRVVIKEKPIPLHDRDRLIADFTPRLQETPVAAAAAASDDVGYLARDTLIDAVKVRDFVSLAAGMGLGKTTTLMALLQDLYPHAKILVTCCRIASINDVTNLLQRNDMQFSRYSDVVGPIEAVEHPHLVTCYESTHRIRGHYDIIIYDEWRSINSSAVSKTNSKFLEQNWQTHLSLTARAEKVIFLDADMLVDGCAYDMQERMMKNRQQIRSNQLLLLADTVKSQAETEHKVQLKRSVVHLKEQYKQATDRVRATVAPHDRPAVFAELAEKFSLDLAKAEQQHFNPPADVDAILHGAMDIVAGRGLNGIHRIVDERVKMKRSMVLVEHDRIMQQLFEDVVAERRVGLIVNSATEAEELGAVLEAFMTKNGVSGSVGVFSGLTDNTKEFCNIAKAWDPHQVIVVTSVLTTGADYVTPIHREYFFPHIHCCTPRDSHQGGGRFRNVVCPDIWIRTSKARPGAEPPVIHSIDRAEVDKRTAACIKKVSAGQAAVRQEQHRRAEVMKWTVGPKVYEMVFPNPVPDLAVLKAYAEAEHSCTRNLSDYLSYFVYMGRRKGYTQEAPKDLSTAEAEELERRLDDAAEVAKDLAADRKFLYNSLDASAFATPEGIKQLEQLASGAFFQGQIACTDKVKQILGGKITKAGLKMLSTKAVAQSAFPAGVEKLKDAKQVNRNLAAMRNFVAYRQFKTGNREVLTGLNVDFVIRSKEDGAMLRRAHPVIAIHVASDLAEALGLTGFTDYSTRIPAARLKSDTVKSVMDRARLLGIIGTKSSGEMLLEQIRQVLMNSVACTLLWSKGQKTFALESVVVKLEADCGKCNLMPADWFLKKHGFAIPAIDQYKHQPTDSLEQMCNLMNLYKDSKSKEFQDYCRQLSDKVYEERKRQRDGHDVSHKQQQKRARLVMCEA